MIRFFDRMEQVYSKSGLKRITALHAVVRHIGDPVVGCLAKVQGKSYPPRFRWHVKAGFLMRWADREILTVSKHLLRPGMTVLDIGANIGYHTLFFSELVGPKGKIYAFEPHPENLEYLARNTRSSKYGNVAIVPNAVSDGVGGAWLFPSDDPAQHSFFQGRSAAPQILVQTVSIDAFLTMHGNPEVGLIKMDIEGAEPMAMRGMSHTIATCRSLALIMEFNPERLLAAGIEPPAFLRELKDMGFVTRVITPNAELKEASMMQIERQMRLGHVDLLCQKG